jgi:hypothetical protein
MDNRNLASTRLVDILKLLLASAPVRLWALILACPPLTFCALWLDWEVIHGPWHLPLDPEMHLRLLIVGYSLGGFILLLAVGMVSLAAQKLDVSVLGNKLTIGGDHDGDDKPDPPPAKDD